MTIKRDDALVRALRFPRGRYKASRAAQLSGIPERTLYDWANHDVLVPDFFGESPTMWSYRDLILLRMVYWLRGKGMERATVAAHVADTREMLSAGDELAARARSDGEHLHRGGDPVAVNGQAAFDIVFEYLDEFTVDDASQFVSEVHQRTLWGPDLRRPSDRTRISPWVMSGEPCIRDTRLPISTIYALNRTRVLSPTAIMKLYTGISREDVEDALELEAKLRGEAAQVAA